MFKSRHGTLLLYHRCIALRAFSRPYFCLSLSVPWVLPFRFFFFTLFRVFPQVLPLFENTKLEITSPFESCGTLKSRHGALRHRRIALCVLSRLYCLLCLSAQCRVGVYLFVSLPLADSSVPVTSLCTVLSFSGQRLFWTAIALSLSLELFLTVYTRQPSRVDVLSSVKSLSFSPLPSLSRLSHRVCVRFVCRWDERLFYHSFSRHTRNAEHHSHHVGAR